MASANRTLWAASGVRSSPFCCRKRPCRARIVAERIRKRAEGPTLTANDLPLRLTVSIGVAEAFTSMPGVDALMRAADVALYEAKKQGRNRTECWTPPAPPKLAAE
ncbi:GGDEF domain-containing protein [Bradyrhizobium sp. ORS 111]|uniref:GGDEF domain-containing protein n=1 Tax=Bradyrhizobium sp. ORS 111 TaxID=1685958 RepID=UPI00388FC620